MTFLTSGLLLEAGVNFKQPVRNITNNPPSLTPTIAADANGNINVVWSAGAGPAPQVYFMRSTNGGDNFSPPLNLSVSSAQAIWPHVAVDDFNNIYVVWNGYFPTQDIYFRKSINGGMSWIPPLPSLATNISQSLLPPGLSGAKEPRVTAEGNGTVYVVWDHLVGPGAGHCQVHYRKSVDGGNNWNPPIGSPATNLSNDPSSTTLAERPDIKVLQGVVYVVWDDNRLGGNWEIFYRASANGGTTWDPALTDMGRNISNNPGISQFPKLAIDQFSINVVWCDTSPGSTQILYNRSTNGTFPNPPRNVSNDVPNSAQQPHIGVDFLTGNIFVVWSDNSLGNYQIFFSCSTNGGMNFSPGQNISRTTGPAGRPALALDESTMVPTIYVVWNDTTPGGLDVFFTHSIP